MNIDQRTEMYNREIFYETTVDFGIKGARWLLLKRNWIWTVRTSEYLLALALSTGAIPIVHSLQLQYNSIVSNMVLLLVGNMPRSLWIVFHKYGGLKVQFWCLIA